MVISRRTLQFLHSFGSGPSAYSATETELQSAVRRIQCMRFVNLICSEAQKHLNGGGWLFSKLRSAREVWARDCSSSIVPLLMTSCLAPPPSTQGFQHSTFCHRPNTTHRFTRCRPFRPRDTFTSLVNASDPSILSRAHSLITLQKFVGSQAIRPPRP